MDAHFKRQDWYTAVDGCCSGGDQYPDFSSREYANIQLLLEVEEGLGRTIGSCWTRENISSFGYDYYREVTSEQPAPSVIDDFDRFTDYPMELGSYPCASSEDLLPFDLFSTFYSYPSDIRDRLNEDSDFERTQHEMLDRARAEFDLTDYYVYEVYRRSDSSIARVSKIGLAWEPFPMEPFTLWSAYFNPDGSIAAFVPWCTSITNCFVMLYGTDEGIAVLHGTIWVDYLDHIIEMEIYEGPYPELPFTVILCDESDGYSMIEESRFFMLLGLQ